MPLPRLLRFILRSALALLISAAALSPVPARAAAGGDLDLAFHGTGWTTLPLTPFGAYDMLQQPDGRLVLCSAIRLTPDPAGPLQPALWRLHPNGSPDLSFNGTGEAILPLPGFTGAVNSLALAPDGRILIAGYRSLPTSPFLVDPQLILARFLPDGRRDETFGPAGAGFITDSRMIFPHHIVLQPDGKILAAGDSTNQRFGTVLRFLPSGDPDTSFGNGTGLFRTVNNEDLRDLILQPDGKILLCSERGFRLFRLLPNGSPDHSFGYEGEVVVLPDGDPIAYPRAGRLLLLPDGRILAGGNWAHFNLSPEPQMGYVLACLLPNGTLDPSFGNPATPGRAHVTLTRAGETYVTRMAMQSDGRIVIGGVAFHGPVDDADIALARFTPDGLPDTTFGTGGQVLAHLGGYESCSSMVLLADHRLLLAGLFAPPNTETGSLLLARFHAPPAIALSVEYPGTEIHWPWSPPLDTGPVTAITRITEITLHNAGLTTLTNIQASLTDESHPGEYHLISPNISSLAPGARTSLHISLTPSSPAPRTATLRLTVGNTNPSLPPRLIPLTGAKATPLQTWRITWFGSPDNSGPGADANDFDHDTLPNFLEYALNTNPHTYTHDPCHPDTPASFTYTRPTSALTEFTYTPESAPAPNGPWSAAGLTTTVLTDNGTMQTVRVNAADTTAPHLFLRLRVTKL